MFPLWSIRKVRTVDYLEVQKTAEQLIHDRTNVRFAPIRDALGVAEKAVEVPTAVFLAIQ